MTIDEAIELMKNEKTCILKADTCDRDCAKCELVKKTENLLSAYDMVIKALEQTKWIPCSERLPEEKDAGILKKLGAEKRSEYVLATVEVKGERMTVTACT